MTFLSIRDLSTGKVLSKQVKLEVSNREERSTREVKIYSQGLKLIRWQHGGAVESIRLGWLFCLQGKQTDLS